jgi:hypothetical protein
MTLHQSEDLIMTSSSKKLVKRQQWKKPTADVPSCSELSARFHEVQLLRKLVNAAELGKKSAQGKLVLKAPRYGIDVYH